MLVGVALLAFNLRPLASQVGPVLPTLQSDLGLNGVTAGVLTSLPTASFAVFGALAAGLARRFGTHRVIVAALVAMALGAAGRLAVGTALPFLALSAVGLAGMAVANVLAPSIVRQHFPDHVGMVTATYSLTLSIGVTLSSAFTVPLAQALGGWRPAFATALIPIALALIPWLFALKFARGHRPEHAGPRISLATVARTKLGWMMAIFFGFQSAQAYSIFGWLPSIYRSAGLSAADAGWMLGIATGLGIPLAFAWPALISRNPRPLPLLILVVSCAVFGYGGLLLVPGQLPWLWAALIAIGTSSFPMILALFGMRARTAAGTAALSGFSQSVGYTIATAGPLALGVVHEITGSWFGPVGLLLVMLVPMTIGGVFTCRAGNIEDELAASQG